MTQIGHLDFSRCKTLTVTPPPWIEILWTSIVVHVYGPKIIKLLSFRLIDKTMAKEAESVSINHKYAVLSPKKTLLRYKLNGRVDRK